MQINLSCISDRYNYSTQLWSPPACHGNWATIIELENVQRRFTRLIDDIGTLPYSERLDALQITTLAERRVRGDLIEVYKIVNGLVEYGKYISFWNKLPSFVRNSVSVIDFKINLEEFKKTNNLVDTGNFWEVSNIVLAKIEGVNYIEKKKQQVQYLYKNPCVAKRKGINIS